MKISSQKCAVEKVFTVDDITSGDCFRLYGENKIYLWTEEDTAVNLINGEIKEYDDIREYPIVLVSVVADVADR